MESKITINRFKMSHEGVQQTNNLFIHANNQDTILLRGFNYFCLNRVAVVVYLFVAKLFPLMYFYRDSHKVAL